MSFNKDDGVTELLLKFGGDLIRTGDISFAYVTDMCDLAAAAMVSLVCCEFGTLRGGCLWRTNWCLPTAPVARIVPGQTC
jgi:hypothetical protein